MNNYLLFGANCMINSELGVFLEQSLAYGGHKVLFEKATHEQAFFNQVWQISCEKPFNQSWRLLWILDHATEKSNHFILPILNDLYLRVLETQNESYIRQGMKLILRCPLVDEYISPMLERCIEWMNNPKAKISSQVMGLEFFYQACLLYPEMSCELVVYIDDLLCLEPSAGYRHRLKKIRKELKLLG